jgi:hypothetical protein
MKTMINQSIFGDKERKTEEEYGQLTFDKIVYLKPFENGVFDKSKFSVNVYIQLDADEEIIDVKQIGEPAYYITAFAIIFAYGLTGAAQVVLSIIV